MKNNYNFGKENLILFQPNLCLKEGMILNMEEENLIENTELIEYTDESIEDELEMEGVEE